MPRVRPRLTDAQQAVRDARAGHVVERAELPPKIGCPACERDQWAAPDGTPRAHQRAARPGDDGYSPEWPAMVACEPPALTLAEQHQALPDELRVTPEMLPPEIADGLTYLVERDRLIDDGTPLAQLPTYAEWRADHA